MKKKISLEEEFSKVKKSHKYSIITLALVTYENKGIYDMHPVLEGYKNVEGTGIDKAVIVVEDLLEKYEEGFTEMYEKGFKNDYDTIYEMCWELTKDMMKEHEATKIIEGF